MIIEKTKNFCISKITLANRDLYFINELKNGRPTGHGGEQAGKYYNTLQDAQNRLTERQKSFDESMQRVKNL